MYETEVFYAEEGLELKKVLESCIFNYYVKNKEEILKNKDLQKCENHHIMDATNKLEILSLCGVENVQTVQGWQY